MPCTGGVLRPQADRMGRHSIAQFCPDDADYGFAPAGFNRVHF